MSVHKQADKTPGGDMGRDRYAELRRILEERRREILSAVHGKIRDVRAEGANNPTTGVLDAAETSEADIQDDIEFALIQMKAETLNEDRRGAAPAGGRHLRLLLRVRRGNLRAPPARAAVRGPLQGLRGSARARAAARAHAGAAARRVGAPPRRPGISFRPGAAISTAGGGDRRDIRRSPFPDRGFRGQGLLQSRRFRGVEPASLSPVFSAEPFSQPNDRGIRRRSLGARAVRLVCRSPPGGGGSETP